MYYFCTKLERNNFAYRLDDTTNTATVTVTIQVTDLLDETPAIRKKLKSY